MSADGDFKMPKSSCQRAPLEVALTGLPREPKHLQRF